jgi:hypothetical protein
MAAICFMVMDGWSFNGFLARCDGEDWDSSGSKGRNGRARPVIGGGGLIAANRCRAVAGDKAEGGKRACKQETKEDRFRGVHVAVLFAAKDT